MNTQAITYRTRSATEEEIFLHLGKCNKDFIPPLDQKTDIGAYAKKIAEKAVTFEAWDERALVGLIAAYFNDTASHTGYITNVSVMKNYKGKGIAVELMNRCIEYARVEKFHEINLEVSGDNSAAIRLYEKFRFTNAESRNDQVSMKLSLET